MWLYLAKAKKPSTPSCAGKRNEQRFRHDHPVGFQVQAQPLIGIVQGLLVGPGREVEDESAVLHGPIAREDVANVTVGGVEKKSLNRQSRCDEQNLLARYSR